jgi:(p)ppGpp synthase/HD superfamily hydrolase
MTDLTRRFAEALQYSFLLHGQQKRKQSEVPYFTHLMSVASLVLENGGDEDQAIAALLHDAVEDQGGIPTLEEIRSKFGERVAGIVEDCSDAFEVPKPPWKGRKEQYLARIPNHSKEARLVSLADKVHNARSILVSLQYEGDQAWERFNGGREGTLWYYHRLADIYRQFGDTPLTRELTRLVAEMDAQTAKIG